MAVGDEPLPPALASDESGLPPKLMIHAGRYFLKSDAVVKTAQGLKAPWSWAAGVRFLPKRWRDRAYDLLARNRYNIFGRYDTCMVPDATMKRRFPE